MTPGFIEVPSQFWEPFARTSGVVSEQTGADGTIYKRHSDGWQTAENWQRGWFSSLSPDGKYCKIEGVEISTDGLDRGRIDG